MNIITENLKLFFLTIYTFAPMDVHTPTQRRKNMQAIKSSRTKIEELLAIALRDRGINYLRSNKKIFGKPDFIVRNYKIAIFCDSEFFHGKDWEVRKHKIKTNVDFWHKKIESNIARDAIVNTMLTNKGWKVIRFWGDEIKKKSDFCLNTIFTEIEKRKAQIHSNTPEF